MTVAEKRQAILEAVESGKVTGSRLEPKRKGATVSKLKTGKPVMDRTIEKLYDCLVEILGQEPAKEQCSNKQDNNDDNKTAQGQSDNIQDNKQDNNMKGNIEIMQEAIITMQQEISCMKETISRIMQEVVSLKSQRDNKTDNNESTDRDNKPDNKPAVEICGFTLHKQKNVVKGKVYWAWYALRRLEGKLARVYVGDDPLQAESKIRAYCQKKGIVL